MTYELKEIKPRSVINGIYYGDKVRIKFVKSKYNPNSYQLIIYFGKEIQSKLKVIKGDRISFSYKEDNPRHWVIKKTEKDNDGYKISVHSKVSIRWCEFIPKDEELQGYMYRDVSYCDENKSITINL